MVFPVVIYRYENWAIKKAECLRIDAFELWCWWRLLTVPWIAWWSNQSIPKRNQPWIFTGRTDTEAPIVDHLMQIANSLEKTLMLGKIEGRRKRGWQRTRWLDGIIDSMDIRLSKFREIVTDRERSLACWSPWDHKESDMTEWLNNNNNLHLGWRRQRLHPRDAEQTPGYILGLLGLQAAAPT